MLSARKRVMGAMAIRWESCAAPRRVGVKSFVIFFALDGLIDQADEFAGLGMFMDIAASGWLYTGGVLLSRLISNHCRHFQCSARISEILN